MSSHEREYKHGESANGNMKKRMQSYEQHGGGESRNQKSPKPFGDLKTFTEGPFNKLEVL